VGGDRGLDNSVIEYRRRGQDSSEIALDEVVKAMT